MMHRRDAFCIGENAGGAVFHAGGNRFTVLTGNLLVKIPILPFQYILEKRMIVAVFVGVGIDGFFILEPVSLFAPVRVNMIPDGRAVVAVGDRFDAACFAAERTLPLCQTTELVILTLYGKGKRFVNDVAVRHCMAKANGSSMMSLSASTVFLTMCESSLYATAMRL